MPSLTQMFSAAGPVIDVYIGVTAAREQALTAAGKQAPEWAMARMLVDTGASHTCVDHSVIGPLKLEPTGLISAHTPTTHGKPTELFQYDVRILLANPSLSGVRSFDALPVSACHLASQGIQGLLGRDVLAQCQLLYNGEIDQFTLCF